MTSRLIQVLVPPPVPVPRAALWIGLLLDLLQALRPKRKGNIPAQRAAAVQRYAPEAGK